MISSTVKNIFLPFLFLFCACKVDSIEENIQSQSGCYLTSY